MGRIQRKKFRAHAPAAKASKPNPKPKDALSAAAVEAAFGKEMLEDEALEEAENDGEDQEEGDDQNKALSRGQRKRMKRRNAFVKKMGLVNRVVQEKNKEAKKKENGMFADLEELQKSLFVAEQNQVKAEEIKNGLKKNLTGKQRQKLAIRELGHLKAVHTHPSFQGNPFAAIQMHLQNTVVQANEATMKKTNENKPDQQQKNKNNKNNKNTKNNKNNKNKNQMDTEE